MKRLELLDCGRFIAACGVVMFHYFFNGIANHKITSLHHIPEIIAFAKYGYLGVEFFFMISGYVIFFSAMNRSASEFAVSRAVRLYPAFWVAILFTTAVAHFWAPPSMAVRTTQVLANFTMVPNLLGYPYVDGVYWTLQLELGFYGVVLLCLLGGWQDRLKTFFLLWPGAMLLAHLAGLHHVPFLGDYYYYFAAGAIFAAQKEKPSLLGWGSLLLCFCFCLRFTFKKAAGIFSDQSVAYSPAVIGALISVYFLFFLALNTKSGSAVKIPGSRMMGGLTYPLYLVHAHFGYMFISRFGADENKWLIYPLAIAISLSVAYLIHQLVEKRYASQWHALFARTLGRVVELINAKTTKIPRVWGALFTRG